MKDNIAISVNDIHKSFRLPHENHSGIKQVLLNAYKGKRGYEIQKVLKGLSFEIEKGDFFGIVGRNGSGKSTLLKLIAGVYTPDSGSIDINGSLTPFIELGVGFNPDLTGRENVFLNGAFLGFDKSEVEQMYDDIVEFAELDKFMDQKLKNYSSGMQVRLAFSIAIRAKSDILVLDEVLAVGDEAFQRKCFQYFAEIKKQGQTVILVTHSMETVLQFCNKAMLVDKGHKMEIGTPLQISQLYRQLNDDDGVTVNTSTDTIPPTSQYVSAKAKNVKKDNKRIINLTIKEKSAMDDPVFAVGIYSEVGEEVYRWTSDEKLPEPFDPKIHTHFSIEVLDIFPVGVFSVNLYIKKRDRSRDYAVFNEITKFEIKNHTQYSRDIRWKIPDKVIVNGKEV